MHTVYLPGDPLTGAGTPIRVTGDEAKHATRVKRLEPGERVLIMNGHGVIITATVEEARRELILRPVDRTEVPPDSPRIEVWSATPKGDRLSTMIEGLAQTGCAEWVALDTKLGVVEPGEGKIERIARISLEACKQSRRAWLMETGRKATFDDALRSDQTTPSADIVLLDGAGEPLRRSSADAVRLLVGPEGGWTADELDRAKQAGARIVSVGPHVMRIETAAVAGCAVVMCR
ncbi:MAG TPA: 16S rRNA (uracil(1498)-N(3))-methyltransferase [Phycisphaerales bacterium]|nr:16S rRNA (uracil(1498)-N(3))-methyltransferase [Phycisphaerales bacterium]